MAVNHADGLMVVSVPLYPIAAGVGAAQAGAGWFAILFVPLGLAVSVAVWYWGRPLIYSILGFGLTRSSKIQNRGIQTIAVLPFLILYLILPVAFACGGLAGVWAGSGWLVRHCL